MKVFVFEEDPSLLKLLTMFFENKGHQVQGFSGDYSCPLYQEEACACTVEKPCADAVIVNTRTPDQERFQMLIDQDKKGCKLPKLNKAIMSSSFTEDHKQRISDQGFHTIKKPFRLEAIANWLEECEDRLKCLE